MINIDQVDIKRIVLFNKESNGKLKEPYGKIYNKESYGNVYEGMIKNHMVIYVKLMFFHHHYAQNFHKWIYMLNILLQLINSWIF